MKKRIPYAEALYTAQRLQALLSPTCERIEIGGSIRRRGVWVGVIEIVTIPIRRSIPTLLGEINADKTLLDEHLEAFPAFYEILSSGSRMKRLIYEGMPVDLFTTDQARWGVKMTLRTGSMDFSKWLVTSRDKGGARRVDRYVKDGRVWAMGEPEPLDTPEEPFVFQALGVPWVPIEQRDRGYWHQDMATFQPKRDRIGDLNE